MKRIDYRLMSETALDHLLTEFILREGTSYGETETPLETKKQRLKQQLKSNKAEIIYDSILDSYDIISREPVA